jgi:hypothetical protein
MNILKKCAKPACIYLAVVLLVVTTSYQSASAAMLGTESFLLAGSCKERRDCVRQVPARQEIQGALVAQGVDPQQAELWLESLTDEEIAMIAQKADDLAAGGDVFIFSLIIIGVIAAAFVIFNYTSVTDVFP